MVKGPRYIAICIVPRDLTCSLRVLFIYNNGALLYEPYIFPTWEDIIIAIQLEFYLS